MLWAGFFQWKQCFANFSTASYFAFTEYTTLGSNFDLPQNWRLLEVEHEIAVARRDRAVQVRTIVHNNAKDHRLRLRLNTGVRGEAYYASEAFCFVRRPMATSVVSRVKPNVSTSTR